MPADHIRLRRAYDEPGDDGFRVLVDGIWPRGRRRGDLRLDLWARDLAPSAALRSWYGHDPERWPEFRQRYLAELADPDRSRALDALAERARHGRVTLVFGARDRDHSQARVLADELGAPDRLPR
jgi:uncharacterized protein YeaO (DUF488 family)